MKNTDKVTLTFGQLKKLVKESKNINESNSSDALELLDNLVDYLIKNKSVLRNVLNYLDDKNNAYLTELLNNNGMYF